MMENTQAITQQLVEAQKQCAHLAGQLENLSALSMFVDHDMPEGEQRNLEEEVAGFASMAQYHCQQASENLMHMDHVLRQITHPQATN